MLTAKIVLFASKGGSSREDARIAGAIKVAVKAELKTFVVQPPRRDRVRLGRDVPLDDGCCQGVLQHRVHWRLVHGRSQNSGCETNNFRLHQADQQEECLGGDSIQSCWVLNKATLRFDVGSQRPAPEHARRRSAYVKDCHTDLILTVLRSVDSDCLNDDSNLPRSAGFFASRAAQAASRTSPGLSVTSAAAPVHCVVTVSIRRQRQSVADPEQWGYPASTSPAAPITSARVSFQCRGAVVKLTDCSQRPSDQTGNHPSPGTTHTHTRAVRLDFSMLMPCLWT